MKRTVVLAIVISLVLPALATAKLVVNRSMFGIAVGSSSTQVRAKLGKPDKVVHISGDVEWLYVRKHLVVMFQGKRPTVGSLFTQSRSERTANGIGVGSTRQQVQSAFPAADCSRKGCLVLGQIAGRTYGTDFALDSSGAVSGILVSQLS